MRYVSFFSGIGGFELGIQRALKNTEIKPVCVGFSEKDKYAKAIYQYHFSHKSLGEATQIVSGDYPDCSFFVAGFPCQSFSRAGNRKGFEDARGTMFFEIARFLFHKRPRHFLLENVADLLSHESGKTFQTILRILTEIGYYVETIVLDSKNFGVPQQRKRVFFIGHFAEQCTGEILTFGESYGSINSGKQSLVNTLTAEHRGGVRTGSFIAEGEFTQIPVKAGYKQGIVLSELGNTLTATYSKSVRNASQPFIYQRKRGYNDGGKKQIAPTLSSSSYHHNNFLSENFTLRRLTPIECARLQGFPDNWADYGVFASGNIKTISDTQKYKVFGNAVTVNVIEKIVCKMFPCLNSA